MNEAGGVPLPPSFTTRRINPWLIVIVVCVVLCCFCIGLIGLLIAFGEPILNSLGLNNLLPVLTPIP
jgi:hypothetical protein